MKDSISKEKLVSLENGYIYDYKSPGKCALLLHVLKIVLYLELVFILGISCFMLFYSFTLQIYDPYYYPETKENFTKISSELAIAEEISTEDVSKLTNSVTTSEDPKTSTEIADSSGQNYLQLGPFSFHWNDSESREEQTSSSEFEKEQLEKLNSILDEIFEAIEDKAKEIDKNVGKVEENVIRNLEELEEKKIDVEKKNKEVHDKEEKISKIPISVSEKIEKPTLFPGLVEEEPVVVEEKKNDSAEVTGIHEDLMGLISGLTDFNFETNLEENKFVQPNNFEYDQVHFPESYVDHYSDILEDLY